MRCTLLGRIFQNATTALCRIKVALYRIKFRVKPMNGECVKAEYQIFVRIFMVNSRERNWCEMNEWDSVRVRESEILDFVG